MSGLLRVFDPDSADEETRRLSRLAQGCWSPLTIVYDPLKAGSIDSTDTVPHDKAIVRAQNANFAPNKRIKGKPESTVFVANLNSSTSERSLRDEFSRCGKVVKATVVEDIITGRSRGYGFVEFSLEGEAIKAYELAHRSWLDGNKIVVDMECGRLLPGWVPRRLGGGFNGRKESGQLRFGCRERPFRKPIKLLTEKEIKRVYEKTMGRKLSSQGKPIVEPSTDALAGESSKISGTSSVFKQSPEMSDLVGNSRRLSKDGENGKTRRDKETRHGESCRHSSDGESSNHGRESDEEGAERRKRKKSRDSSKHAKRKKKRRHRSRSQSYSSEEDKHKGRHHHRKRKKEYSKD